MNVMPARRVAASAASPVGTAPWRSCRIRQGQDARCSGSRKHIRASESRWWRPLRHPGRGRTRRLDELLDRELRTPCRRGAPSRRVCRQVPMLRVSHHAYAPAHATWLAEVRDWALNGGSIWVSRASCVPADGDLRRLSEDGVVHRCASSM